jgi:hypothetical protein
MNIDFYSNTSNNRNVFHKKNQVSMKKNFVGRVIILSIVGVLIGTLYLPLSASKSITQNYICPLDIINGQVLFAPMNSRISYLIDNTGAVNYTWLGSYIPGEAVRWLGHGTILRTIRVSGSFFGDLGGGAGGGVQKIESDGTISWDFRYDTNGYLSHHDIMPLPSGNVLMIAWETKTRSEAIAAGRNPLLIPGNSLMPDEIIEVQPTGPTSGAIVWEWHVWDHLIQDYNSSKENYGIVRDHPELVDINYVGPGSDWIGGDWLHSNSVDYNEQFDQILISVCYFNELWVIDHSTTTAEAASHTGGNSEKGGDLLYRWGNPQAYRAGTASDQKLFGQHDATWIKPDCPGIGDILVFNNGANRPAGRYSSVDEISPPVNEDGEYYLTPGSAYGPTAQTWIYTANPPTSFYSSHLSGAQRLTNGNTLICNGEAGKILEVTPDGTTLWQYTNTYPDSLTNNLFKVVYIPPEEPPEPNVPDLDCTGSLSWSNIKPGATVTGSFQVQNTGDNGSLLNWTINTSLLTWGTWTVTPQNGENLTPEAGKQTVQLSVVAPDEKNSDFEGYIRVENRNDPFDFDLIPISLKTIAHSNDTPITVIHQFLSTFLQRHLFIEKLGEVFFIWFMHHSH